MICKNCEKKPIHRGVKQVKCFKCNQIVMINSAFSHICKDCSNVSGICQYCGKDMKHNKPIPEVVMHYNCQDKRFYIYARSSEGERYLYDCQDARMALDMYIEYCKILDENKDLTK